MTSSLKGLLRGVLQPQLQCVRFKSKIRITKPNPPHFRRHVVEKLCVPFVSRERRFPHIPLLQNCDANKEKPPRQESPLAMIMAKELRNWFDHSKLIGLFHMNSMDEEDKFDHAVTLKQAGFKMFTFETEIVRKAVTGTIYEPILILFQSHTAIAVSQDPKLNVLLETCKKLPLLILMGAVINNNTLLDHLKIEQYGKLENIESAQLQLTSVLNVASQNLVQQLNSHPFSLVQCLSQISKGEGSKS
ncbi:hypothetical protein RUM43_009115 [Polyplax serrata]|uniref:Large ribosomal subunit protein uL10m n=1 Tax=Polyplax serrata TaxID=468196 RepID=A0AAN8PAB2_POLSC